MKGRPILVGLAGPSAAGKSTVAERAVQVRSDLLLIKQDAFYKDEAEFPLRYGRPNWDVPESVHLTELYEVLVRLKAGRPAWLPEYDKRLGQRLGQRYIQPVRLVLVEGFLLFYDWRVYDMFDLTVYLDVSPEVQWQRRRQRQPQLERDYFNQVIRPSYECYGQPGRALAQVVIEADASLELVGAAFERELERVAC